MSIDNCPKCNSSYCYELNNLYICPECNYEWNELSQKSEEKVFKDSNGNILQDGDTVAVIKTLALGGSSIKRGTIVRNIRLLDPPVKNHDIDCRIEGFGKMLLKTEVVKKV